MLLLLLAALAQEGAGDLTITRPAGWLRSDDAARKTVTLVPPGLPPGALCSVTFTPAQPYPGGGADYHAATWAGLTGGMTVVTGAKAEAAGGFTRSWAELLRPDGAKVWITLYTAVAQGRAQTLLFLSSVPDLFQRHAGAVDAMVQAAAVPGLAAPKAPAAALAFPEDGVTIPAPENWTKQPGEKGAWVYIPPDLRPGQSCAFLLLPSEASTADAAAYQEAAVKAATAGLKSVKVLKTGEWGRFRYHDLEVEGPQGRGKASVYTVRFADRGQMGIYTCNDDAVHVWANGWVPAVLLKAYFPDPRLAAGAPFVPIVEVFFKAEMEMGVTVDLRAGTSPTFTKKYLALFKNGLAMRVDAFSNNLLDSTHVSGGLASLDAEALLKETAPDRRRGTWTEKDGSYTFRWSTGTEVETYTRNGVRLEGPKAWTKVTLPDGVKVEGDFLKKNDLAGIPPWTLRLTKAGRFEGDGLHNMLGGRLASPLFPEKGGGNYEIRTGTIFLRYDNGFRTSLALQFGGDDVNAPTSVILNGTAFDRR